MRALRDLHLPHLAVERCAQGQQFHLAARFGHHGLLALRLELLVARIQACTGALQGKIALCGGKADIGLLHHVLGAIQIILGHRAAIECTLVALQIALCRSAIDAGLVKCTLRVGACDLRVQLRAAGGGLKACQRGFFLHQLAAQLGAVNRGQRLATGHLVTGNDGQVHGAGSDGIQRGAVGGDHFAFGTEVAHQVTTGHLRDADPRSIERLRATHPTGRHPCGQQQHACARDDGHDPFAATGRGVCHALILAGGIADAATGGGGRVRGRG